MKSATSKKLVTKLAHSSPAKRYSHGVVNERKIVQIVSQKESLQNIAFASGYGIVISVSQSSERCKKS